MDEKIDSLGRRVTCKDAVSLAKEGSWSHRLCYVSELPGDEGAHLVPVDGRQIAIFKVDGMLYAVDDLCTHAHSSLSQDGERCALVIECGLHRAQFSLETGVALSGPTRKPLRRYALSIIEDDVFATELEKIATRRSA